MHKPKVFGIGFHKTGTTSLDKALTILGYSVCGVRLDLASSLSQKDLKPAFDVVDQYDAFQDNPWPIIYKELDRQFPGSKFILTLRDEQSWIKSNVKHFGKDITKMREWIYGVGFPLGNEEIYLERYRKHNREVREYFEGRDDLLIVNWAEGSGWEELCNFLDEQIPATPFPHANKSTDRTKAKFRKSFLGRLFNR